MTSSRLLTVVVDSTKETTFVTMIATAIRSLAAFIELSLTISKMMTSVAIEAVIVL